MAATQPNHRASLLAGLRTGGVRSTSIPHTAAPGGSFNVPRFTSVSHRDFEEEDDEVPDIQDLYVNQRSNRIPQAPMTSAVDGPRFSYQQNPPQRASIDQNPFSPGIATPQQQQAFQMQMMQMEIFRLQVCTPELPPISIDTPVGPSGTTAASRAYRPEPKTASAASAPW
jgi:hypothetical protein